MTAKKDSLLFKFSILSLSALLMLAPVVSAALPSMYNSFPGQSKSAVEMLLTIPNFGIIAALFLSPLLINLIGEKKTIMIGLGIALFCGVFPLFSVNYYLILITRFMFGAGIGLFNSLAVSLLSKFYEGDELSTMMGYQTMMGSLCAALVSFAVSYLVTIS